MASGGRSWENDGINYVYEVSEEQLASLQRALTESGGGEVEWSDEEDGGGRPLTPEDLWSEKHILDAAQLALNDHETKTGQKLNLKGLVSGEYTIVSGNLYNLNLRVTDESGKPYLYKTVVYTCPMYNRLQITGKLFPEARGQKAARLL